MSKGSKGNKGEQSLPLIVEATSKGEDELPPQPEQLHDFVFHYFFKLPFRKLTCGDKFACIILIIFFIPVIIECSLLSIILAATIPLGYIFGLLEHKLPFIWVLIVLFIQVGGLLDQVADLLLLWKFGIIAWKVQFDGSTGDEDVDKLEGTELTLFLLRILFTMVGVIPYYALNWLDQRGGWEVMKWRMGGSIGPKPEGSSKDKARPYMVFLLVIVAIFWKVFIIGIRVAMLYLIIKSLLKHFKLEEQELWKVQWYEVRLSLDLLWSGFPLGVLTAMELFYYEREELVFDSAQNFELIKLSALLVDLVGFAYLVWFVIVGLSKKLFHHGDHHGAHHANVNSERVDFIAHQ